MTEDTENTKKTQQTMGIRKRKTGRARTQTKPTEKATRFKNLSEHCERHPKDTQSAKHLANEKWANYR